MKVTPSPLVSEMRGKTAGLVAATWKGIQYVRMHVIPQNPQTVAQTAVRDALARCVTLWRSLALGFKVWLDTYYDDYAMSGFNGFIKLCRTLEQTGALLKPLPDSPYIPAPSAFTPATGAGASGDIDVTWTDNAPAGVSRMWVMARQSDLNIFSAPVGVAADTETATITGLEPDQDHDVYGWFGNVDTGAMGTTAGELDIKSKA